MNPKAVPHGMGMRVILTARFIEFLHDSRIFSHPGYGVQRWQPGNPLMFVKSTVMEPYSCIARGDYLNTLGSYSFMSNPVIGTYEMHFGTGRYCSIGGGLRIMGGSHPTTTLSSSPVFYEKHQSWVRAAYEDNGIADGPFVTRPKGKGCPIVENDVWLGGDVTLSHGVRIGNGAVVAANALVTKDVPDYAIVGGNPAKIIRYRFSDEIIADLMDIQFWRFNMPDLKQFNMQDIESFVRDFRAAEHQIKPWEPKKVNIWQSWCEIEGG